MKQLSVTLIFSLMMVGMVSLRCQPVRFVEESIDFRYEPGLFVVNGIYTFTVSAQSSVGHVIRYPLPFEHHDLDTIWVVDINSGNTISFEEGKKGISFTLQPVQGDTLQLNIGYRQRIFSDTLRYILTTTSRWGKPLRHAVYRFECSEPGIIPSFNYSPDQVLSKDNRYKYIWIKNDFMPETDFIVTLKKR